MSPKSSPSKRPRAVEDDHPSKRIVFRAADQARRVEVCQVHGAGNDSDHKTLSLRLKVQGASWEGLRDAAWRTLEDLKSWDPSQAPAFPSLAPSASKHPTTSIPTTIPAATIPSTPAWPTHCCPPPAFGSPASRDPEPHLRDHLRAWPSGRIHPTSSRLELPGTKGCPVPTPFGSPADVTSLVCDPEFGTLIDHPVDTLGLAVVPLDDVPLDDVSPSHRQPPQPSAPPTAPLPGLSTLDPTSPDPTPWTPPRHHYPSPTSPPRRPPVYKFRPPQSHALPPRPSHRRLMFAGGYEGYEARDGRAAHDCHHVAKASAVWVGRVVASTDPAAKGRMGVVLRQSPDDEGMLVCGDGVGEWKVPLQTVSIPSDPEKTRAGFASVPVSLAAQDDFLFLRQPLSTDHAKPHVRIFKLNPSALRRDGFVPVMSTDQRVRDCIPSTRTCVVKRGSAPS